MASLTHNNAATTIFHEEVAFNGKSPITVTSAPSSLSLGRAFTISLWISAYSSRGEQYLFTLGRNPQNYFNEMILQITDNIIHYWEFRSGNDYGIVLKSFPLACKFLSRSLIPFIVNKITFF